MDSDAIAAGIWKFLWQLAAVILLLAVVYVVGYAVFMGLLFLYATGNLINAIAVISIPLSVVACVNLLPYVVSWLWQRTPIARRRHREFWTNFYFAPDAKSFLMGTEIRQFVERSFKVAESEDEVEEIKRICVDTLRPFGRESVSDAGAVEVALHKFLQRKTVAVREQERNDAQARAEFAEAVAAAGSEPVDLTTAQEHLNLAADMLQAARGTEAEDACRKNHAEKLAALLAAKSHQTSMR